MKIPFPTYGEKALSFENNHLLNQDQDHLASLLRTESEMAQKARGEASEPMDMKKPLDAIAKVNENVLASDQSIKVFKNQ